MSEKSPISLLQEYSIVEFKKYPDYSYVNQNMGHSSTFKCSCVVSNLTTSAIASSKSNAKLAAAQEMINKLRIGVSSSGSQNLISASPQVVNYVGILNEHCSKNRLQPVFTELQDGADFRISCMLSSYESHGFGKNKKSAKQECARKMLELLQVAPQVQPPIQCNLIDSFALVSFTPDIKPNISSEKPLCKDDPIAQDCFTVSSSTSDIKPNLLLEKSVGNNNDADSKAYAMLITANPVGALNEYSQKNKHTKPDYLNCGKEGERFKMKCLFLSFCACGSGLTVMFAKQDCARKMLKILGFEAYEDKQEANLIDLCSTTVFNEKVPQISSITPQQVYTEKEVLNIYEKYSTDVLKPQKNIPLVEENVNRKKNALYKEEKCIVSKPAPRECELENKLVGLGVTFTINREQGSPYILSLHGIKDGNEKHLIAVGNSYEVARVKLLKDAISSFSSSLLML